MKIDHKKAEGDTESTDHNMSPDSFTFSVYQKEEIIQIPAKKGFYRIFFLLGGECELLIEPDQTCMLLLKDHLSLIPAKENLTIQVKEKSSLLILFSSNLFRNWQNAETGEKEELNTFILTPAIKNFCRVVTLLLQDGFRSKEWQKVKEEELFLLLQYSYAPEQLQKLFTPVLDYTSKFKQNIKNYLLYTSSIPELLTLSQMKRSTFEKQFKKTFGTSPYQWILKTKATEVNKSLANPTLTLKQIRELHGFNSAASFVRFCRRHFGRVPSRMKKEMPEREGNNNEFLKKTFAV